VLSPVWYVAIECRLMLAALMMVILVVIRDNKGLVYFDGFYLKLRI
jgi:hypothetical protein